MMLARVTAVAHVGDHVLDLEFADGSRGRVDLRSRLAGRPGLLGALEDVDYFKLVQLDPQAGTICWPNGVDLCPDMLHHDLTGQPLPGEHGEPARAEATSGGGLTQRRTVFAGVPPPTGHRRLDEGGVSSRSRR